MIKQKFNLQNTEADQQRVSNLIYPDEKNKEAWDLFMTVILLVTCVLTPYNIAFVPIEDITSKIVSGAIDVLFAIDMIVIFNSVYFDENMGLITNRKLIAKNYLLGWFAIDLLAIIPFDIILNQSDMTSLVRVARVGKLYKLVKLTKLIRVLKMVKEKSKLLKYIGGFLQLSLGFERLSFFLLAFLMMTHILTCLWVMIASFIDD